MRWERERERDESKLNGGKDDASRLEERLAVRREKKNNKA